MLLNASAIMGRHIAARDGQIGSIVDFLFDDTNWHVRWAVVETGNWLAGRKVLLPTSVLNDPDATGSEFPVDEIPVDLTKQQVKDSPDVNTERPVSRQLETHVYNYYGWSPYWGNGLYMGAYGYGAGLGYSPFLGRRHDETQKAVDAQHEDDDPHLRSVKAVTGYHIHARDGEIGHLADVLVEAAEWRVHYLIVDTKNWWPGKKVLIWPSAVEEIDWNAERISVDIDRETVKASPIYDASKPVDATYENHFNNYYGGIGPSDGPGAENR